MVNLRSYLARLISRAVAAIDDVEEEYRLNVVACHPFSGNPPITLEEYKALRGEPEE